MRTMTFPLLLFIASTTYARYSVLVILAVTLFLLFGEAARAQYYNPYDDGPSAEEELYERMERERRWGREEAEAMRDYGWQMDYLRLHTCAKYNNGCAQEFYGRDWP